MRNIMWTILLVALVARSSMAEVTNVSITITPQFAIEDITKRMSSTCTGVCKEGPCEYEYVPPSKAITKTFKRNDPDNTFTCTVKDTGDNQTRTKSETFDIHYGPDSINAGIYSSNKILGPGLNVIKGRKSNQYSIECRRGACSKCTMSWTGPVSGTSTNETLPLFASNTEIQKMHTGTYTCKAENGLSGKTWEKNLEITVQYAPEVSLEWNEVTNTLTCTARGVPATYSDAIIVQKTTASFTTVRTFTWRFINGVAKQRFHHRNYQDTGNYSCTTNNGITSEGELNKTKNTIRVVQDKPLLVQAVDSYNVSKGDELRIVIMLYAIPERLRTHLTDPKDNTIHTVDTTETKLVRTEFHNIPVHVPGIRLTVHIGQVLESYFNGSLNLLINNTEGNVQKKVTLFPEGAPDIPSNFSLYEKTHNTVKFGLVTGYFNGGSQTLVLEYRKPGNITEWINGTSREAGEEKNILSQLDIHHLEPEAVYEFRAYSYNEYARSGYTTVITETLRPTPLPLAIIIGVSGGVLAVIIFVIIIAFIVKKRRQVSGSQMRKERPKVYQNTELTGSFPMSRGIGSNEYTSEPKSRDSTDFDSDHQTYVNTQIGPPRRIPIQDEKPKSRQETVIYQNTQLMPTFSGQKNSGNTVPRDDTEPTMAPYLELQGSGEKVEEAYVSMTGGNVEEAYLTMNDPKGLTQASKHKTMPKQESLDNGYLDMNQSKALVEATRQKNTTQNYTDMKLSNQKVKTVNNANVYSNMEFETKDYENVTKKMAPPVPHKPGDTPRVGRDSVPEGFAPPPPNPSEEENNYMNIRLKP